MRLDQYFEWSARETPSREFARQDGRQISFAEARAEARAMAGALHAAGLEPGDRFCYLSKNSIEFLIGYLAASMSGTVIVPLNYRLAPPEWSALIADATARLVVVRGELVDAMAGLRSEHPAVRHWIAIDHPGRGEWRDYREWLAAAPNELVEGPPVDELCQMYTSGTTGQPKGAVLTHASVTTNAWQVSLTMPERLERGQRVLLVMPVFHAGAAGQIFGGIVFGSSFVIHEDFDPKAVVRSLSEDRIAVTSLVPAMIRACLPVAEAEPDRRYRSLVAMYYGASPIDAPTLRRAIETFQCPFYQAYGMTETSTVLALLSDADHRRTLAGDGRLLLSAGRAIPGTELRVADPSGQEVPIGSPGQVLARGPQVMKGYWRRAEATAAALAGGWMHTGDVGYLDQDGYLYLLDRLNDTINSGGENVYPREVEEVILGHPGVSDVAIIGVPDDRWGEAVLAVVVKKLGADLTDGGLIDHCRTRIAGYKIPRQVVFVDRLPRNATGKVLRRELREPYWKNHSRRVG